MMITNEFADLRSDFGPLEAHLMDESAKNQNMSWGGATCHEQLPKGPDVTLSASAAFVRATL